jgi:hypothetical protein
MKNNTLLLIRSIAFLVLSPGLVAQDIMWKKSFGGRHEEYLADVRQALDYGFILGGSSLSTKS